MLFRSLVPVIVLVTLAIQHGVAGPFVPQVLLYAVSLFVVCMVCHGELVRLRPSRSHLTAFYLSISAGGAVGGVFVGILAPLYFPAYWELSIALMSTLALVAVVLWRDRGSAATAYVPLLASALLVVLVYAESMGPAALALFQLPQHWPYVAAVGGLPALTLYLFGRRRAARTGQIASAVSSLARLTGRISPWNNWPLSEGARRFGAIAGALALLGLVHISFAWDAVGSAVTMSRNFFGVLRVSASMEADDKLALSLWHGRTLHGLQYLSPERAMTPTAYYTAESGIGWALQEHTRRREGQPLRVGVVGLGVGTLATYGRPGDHFRFYEIDPNVVRLAAGPQALFSFVKHSGANIEIILGDGRISLEREDPQRYDVLAVDAFSSGSIPVHLLTREAFEVYLTHLEPRAGVLALHVSNRYLALAPVVAALAQHFGLALVTIDRREPQSGLPSEWLLLARTADVLPPGAPRPAARQRALWTDDYSNLLPAIRWTRPRETVSSQSVELLESDALLLDVTR